LDAEGDGEDGYSCAAGQKNIHNLLGVHRGKICLQPRAVETVDPKVSDGDLEEKDG
jgi:hypothetical protein